MDKFLEGVTRRKTLRGNIMQTELLRCLTTFDVILVGMNAMIGSGIYVLAGEIARDIAGPAVVLSFLIAGIASGLSAWCYAEFGSRVPTTGSAYVYTYLTIGELAAFVIGWNMILEQMIGLAAVTRGLVGYINEMADGKMWDFTRHTLHMKQIDPYGPVVILLLTILVCFGAKKSLNFNNVLALLNVSIIGSVTIAGFALGKFSNWSPFMPFGTSSVFQGAAQAYFAYVGYDAIAIASEEAKDPGFSVPVALAFDVFFVCVVYCLNSAALTLMVPYKYINVSASFAAAFGYHHIKWAKYVICVGAIAAMVPIAQVFTLPRCIYAMAQDGLIYKFLARVNSRTQVPLFAVFIGSFFVCCFAAIFTIKELAEFLSIGTLMAYIIVALAVIVLRYLPQDPLDPDAREHPEVAEILGPAEKNMLSLKQIIALTLFVVLIIPICILLTVTMPEESIEYYLIGVGVLAALAVGCLVYLRVVSIDNGGSTVCKVPLIPFLPGLSAFINIYLMCHLCKMTWVRFGVWMTLGFIIYFSYGIRHSKAKESASTDESSNENEENFSIEHQSTSSREAASENKGSSSEGEQSLRSGEKIFS